MGLYVLSFASRPDSSGIQVWQADQQETPGVTHSCDSVQLCIEGVDVNVRHRSAAVFGILALSAGVLTAGSLPAGAAVPSDTCGGSVYVAPDEEVTSNATGAPIATVQFRRDSSYRYWSCITFFSPVPTGYWGMARLHRERNGSNAGQFHCDMDGGTRHVTAGGRFCRTPKILATSGDQFWVEGDMYRGSASVAHGYVFPPRR